MMRFVYDPTRLDDAGSGGATGVSDGDTRVDDGVVFEGAELLPPVFHEDGSVTVDARIARPGIYVYRNPDGSTRRELVTSEVLAQPDDLATLRRVAVTLRHPAERAVSAQNAEDVIVGDVGETVTVEPDGGIRAQLRVRFPAAIEALRRGVREISPGYGVGGRYDPTPGIDPVHGAYDARQLGRTYNHVAIVDRARGGAGCHARVDHTDSESPVNPILAMLCAALGIPVTDGMTDQMAGKACNDSIGKMKADAASAAEGKAAAEKVAGEAQAVATDAKAKCDATEALLAYDGVRAPAKDSKPEADRLDALDRYADAREQLHGIAASHGIEAKELKGKSLAEARRMVATKIDPELRADASDEYVVAYLDLKAKDAGERHPYRDAFTRVTDPARTDAADPAGRRAPPVDRAFASRMKSLQA